MKLKSNKGFTLIELLVVIVIIGILATLVTVALSSAKVKARDAKRISDIKQMQTALELYYNEESTYPPTNALVAGQALVGAVSGKTFMGKVPAGPNSGETYTYNQINGGTSYTLGYVLEKPVNEFAAGAAIALPGNINNQCIPNCINKNCGDDGCGGFCAPNNCTGGSICYNGSCCTVSACGGASGLCPGQNASCGVTCSTACTGCCKSNNSCGTMQATWDTVSYYLIYNTATWTGSDCQVKLGNCSYYLVKGNDLLGSYSEFQSGGEKDVNSWTNCRASSTDMCGNSTCGVCSRFIQFQHNVCQ